MLRSSEIRRPVTENRVVVARDPDAGVGSEHDGVRHLERVTGHRELG